MKQACGVLCRAGLVAVMACVWGEGQAHGIEEELPTLDVSDLTLAAPIVGTEEFLAALSKNPYPLLSADEAAHLEGIARLIKAGDGSRDGTAFEDQLANGQSALYSILASQQLLSLVQQQEELVTLDWKAEHRDPRADDGVRMMPLRDVLLLKLVDGPGETAFSTRPVNLSFSGDPTPIPVRVQRGGTTYLLMPLDEIPIGRAGIMLQCEDRTTGEPFQWDIVTLETVKPGQLTVSIRDEEGLETPVHLRLEEVESGALWEPPNAVDLGPIMTEITKLPIYGPGRAVTHYMPGSYRGVYWLVPGDFSTAIPPGEWRIAAHKGYEYAPWRGKVSVTSGEHATIEINLQRHFDMPSEGWWSGDDHVHARLLHSEDAAKIMAYAKASDVHVANVLEMGDESRTWYSQRGFGREFRVRSGDYVLVPGQEDPRSVFGHVIGMNIQRLTRFPDQYLFYDVVADELHRQGAFYGHTHVGEGYLGVEKDLTLLMPRGKSDFASIMQNVLGTELYYQYLNLGFKLTASAGSDVPYGGVVGVTRVYAYTGPGEGLDVDAWFDAFGKGRTFVTNGPMIDLRINGAMPGEVLTLDGNPLKIEATARGIPHESAPVLIELIANGDVIASLDSNGVEDTVILNTEITEEHGSWMALRVTGANGSRAHTTPIYVAREDFRHWRFEDVKDLVNARRETLTEIEAMIADRVRAFEAGEVAHTNAWSIVAATTADGLRERIAIASDLYDELLEQWEREHAAGRRARLADGE